MTKSSFEEIEERERQRRGLPRLRRPQAADLPDLVRLFNRDKRDHPENYDVVPSNWNQVSLRRQLSSIEDQVVLLIGGQIKLWAGGNRRGDTFVFDWLVVDTMPAADTYRAINHMALGWMKFQYTQGVRTCVFSAVATAGIWKIPWFDARKTVEGTENGIVKTYAVEFDLKRVIRRAEGTIDTGMQPGDPNYLDPDWLPDG